MVEGYALNVTVGFAFTVTVVAAVLVHPFPSVPVTVYTVVEVGDTVFGLPVPKPPLQLYEVAPPAVSVEEAPLQIVEGDALNVAVGFAFTVTVAVAVLVQPFPSVPVTVYTVVEDGDTVFGLPVPNPPLQLYDVAPPAVRVEEAPLQMVEGDALNVTVGFAFTVTVVVTVLVQPFPSVPVTVYTVVEVGDTVFGLPVPKPPLQL